MDYCNRVKRGFKLNSSQGVVYLSVPSIDETSFYINGFTTRIGGVSDGSFSSLNLSLSREANRENVKENYRRLSNAIGLELSTFTACHYEHGNGVELLNKTHLGAGVLRENPLPFCDGVITKQQGITAVTMHADCTPIFFADKKGRACGVCHAGWKGTYKRIAQQMIKKLEIPVRDVLVGIGPAICRSCFEVKEDVGGLFAKEWGEEARLFSKDKSAQFVDLIKVTMMQLEEMGIPPENVTLSDLCTYENPELFYSHRRDKGNTGAMVSLIALK